MLNFAFGRHFGFSTCRGLEGVNLGRVFWLASDVHGLTQRSLAPPKTPALQANVGVAPIQSDHLKGNERKH